MATRIRLEVGLSADIMRATLALLRLEMYKTFFEKDERSIEEEDRFSFGRKWNMQPINNHYDSNDPLPSLLTEQAGLHC